MPELDLAGRSPEQMLKALNMLSERLHHPPLRFNAEKGEDISGALVEYAIKHIDRLETVIKDLRQGAEVSRVLLDGDPAAAIVDAINGLKEELGVISLDIQGVSNSIGEMSGDVSESIDDLKEEVSHKIQERGEIIVRALADISVSIENNG